jgi:hypothetical protein
VTPLASSNELREAEPRADLVGDRLARVAATLLANNIEAIVVDTPRQAREAVLERLPEGAEVHWGKSKTLDDVGLTKELESGRFDALRPRYLAMDRATQAHEIRKLIGGPDFMLGSVNALTDDGELVAASYSGSQLGPYLSGAGRVILVVGSQKLVHSIEDALARIRDVAFPYEDARLRETLGVPTRIAKIAILAAEGRPGRTTVVLVRQPVGV